jgi:hypothetical protein
VARDAEIALERLQHLNLAGKRRALDDALRMNCEAVANLAWAGTGTDLGPAYFALPNLGARPSRGVGLAGPKNQFGGLNDTRQRQEESRGY